MTTFPHVPNYFDQPNPGDYTDARIEWHYHFESPPTVGDLICEAPAEPDRAPEHWLLLEVYGQTADGAWLTEDNTSLWITAGDAGVGTDEDGWVTFDEHRIFQLLWQRFPGAEVFCSPHGAGATLEPQAVSLMIDPLFREEFHPAQSRGGSLARGPSAAAGPPTVSVLIHQHLPDTHWEHPTTRRPICGHGRQRRTPMSTAASPPSARHFPTTSNGAGSTLMADEPSATARPGSLRRGDAVRLPVGLADGAAAGIVVVAQASSVNCLVQGIGSPAVFIPKAALQPIPAMPRLERMPARKPGLDSFEDMITIEDALIEAFACRRVDHDLNVPVNAAWEAVLSALVAAVATFYDWSPAATETHLQERLDTHITDAVRQIEWAGRERGALVRAAPPPRRMTNPGPASTLLRGLLAAEPAATLGGPLGSPAGSPSQEVADRSARTAAVDFANSDPDPAAASAAPDLPAGTAVRPSATTRCAGPGR